MREIKFRAWDGLEMYSPILSEGLIFRDYREFEDFVNSEDVLMQYTGLKDKNGQEIYEGDIIKRKSYIDVVKWEEIYPSDDMGVFAYGFIDYENMFACKVEVIGNIYENKNLLRRNSNEF